MAGLIPDEVLEEIRSRVDIVDIISEYVVLKKTGRNYSGLCPFHDEKTPSFTVSSEKQMFYCFGCGAGGNLFTFLMRAESLDFPETARMLADRLGISLAPYQQMVAGPGEVEKDRLLQLTELAARFYHHVLLKENTGAWAVQYLKNRGVDQESIQNFQLGFSPGLDSFFRVAVRKGYTPAEAEKAGLAQKGQDGRFYDRFRGRLMFPIFDVRGKVIGFGGRVLDDSQPKYLNSPETPLFQKGKQLYGLFQGRRQIRDEDRAIIVEGYLDVIMSHQCGLKNTVAPLGTALGKDQIRLLFRYSDRVTVAFDSDPAGMAATMRSIDLLHECGGHVAVATILEGKDPDELLRKHGLEHYRETVLNRAVSVIEYKLGFALGRADLNTIAGKVQVVSELLPALAATTNEVEKEEFVKLVSRRLSLGEGAIQSELAKFLGKMRKTGMARDRNENLRDNSNRSHIEIHPASRPKPAGGQGLGQDWESQLLWLMLDDPEILARVQTEVGVDFFRDPVLIRMASKAVELHERGCRVTPALLIDHLDNDASRELTALIFQEASYRQVVVDRERTVDDYLRRIKADHIKQEIATLTRALEESDRSGDQDRTRALQQEIDTLNRLWRVNH